MICRLSKNIKNMDLDELVEFCECKIKILDAQYDKLDAQCDKLDQIKEKRKKEVLTQSKNSGAHHDKSE